MSSLSWRDLTWDEFAVLQALREFGLYGALVEQIQARTPRYYPVATTDGRPLPFGRERTRQALLELGEKNLVVRHGRYLRFSIHAEGRELVDEYRAWRDAHE